MNIIFYIVQQYRIFVVERIFRKNRNKRKSENVIFDEYNKRGRTKLTNAQEEIQGLTLCQENVSY